MIATTKLTPDIREILQSAKVAGRTLELTGTLDRATYTRVAKAIEMMGGKWDRKAKCHVFEDFAEEVVADAVSSGAVINLKKEFQFFETPAPLAERLVELADVRPGDRVLEPSAGGGRIVDAIIAAGGIPSVCELHDGRREALAARGLEVLGADFLCVERQPFDAVVANPPFTRGSDVHHVIEMLAFVSPGGRLVSIMSTAWTWRTSVLHKSFREQMELRRAKWTPLEAGTFRSSGTDVATGILEVQL